jgi:hypothetical protein
MAKGATIFGTCYYLYFLGFPMCLVFGQIYTVFIQSMILHACGTMLRVINGFGNAYVIWSSYEFFDVVFGMTHDAPH